MTFTSRALFGCTFVLFFWMFTASGVAQPTSNGLLLWLKADSLSLADGEKVTRWGDDSGGNYHALAREGNEPTFRQAGLNGKPTVLFNDFSNASMAGQFLDTSLNYDANGQSFTIFAVFKSNPSPDGANWRDTVLQQLDDPTLGTNALGRTILFSELNERRDLRVFSFAGANLTQSRQPLHVNGWAIQTLVQSAVPNGVGIAPVVGTNITMALFRNGAPDGVRNTTTNGIASAGIWRVGDNKPRAGGLNGEIAEILVYRRAVSTEERINIETYLAEKYGLMRTGVTLTVNSGGNDDTAGNGLTLTEAIKFINGDAPRAPSGDEIPQISGDLSTTGRKEIHFQIPTTPPEAVFDPLVANRVTEESLLGDSANFFIFDSIIAAPDGGFPIITQENVVINGYTQPRGKLNTFPVTGTNNNARLRVSIDMRNKPNVPYVFSVQGKHVHIQGLSFMDSTDGQRTAVVYESGAIGGQVSGCRFGMFLTAQEVYSGFRAVLIRNTEGGQVIGTDGDGAGDIGEANIFLGHVQAIGIENAREVRVAGNWFGFFPGGSVGVQADPGFFGATRSGISAANASELIIGTNGDGISDSLEPNYFGNLNGFVLAMGAGSDLSQNGRFAGNVVGRTPLGTPATNNQFFVDGLVSNFLIGSNLDGVSDDLEANQILNHSGTLITYAFPGMISYRANQFKGNTGPLFANLHNTWQGVTGITSLQPQLSAESVTCKIVGTLPLFPPEHGVKEVEVDLYLADPDTVDTQPQGAIFIGKFLEGGRQDLDPTPGGFAFGIPRPLQNKMGEAIGGSGVALLLVTANYKFQNQPGYETSPFSNVLPVPFAPCDPPSLPVVFKITRIVSQASGVTLSWEADAGELYSIEMTEDLNQPFQTLVSGVPGPDYVDAQSLGRVQRFYRVRLP